MSIRFSCRCGKMLKAPDDKIGKKILCPDCGDLARVPDRNTSATPIVATTTQEATHAIEGKAAKGLRKRPQFAFEDTSTRSRYSGYETMKMLSRGVVPILIVAAIVIVIYLLSQALTRSSVSPSPKGMQPASTPEAPEVR